MNNITTSIFFVLQCEGGKSSRTTQLIRKDVYSNMKLPVSDYSGHHQVSIPIKGGLYI